MHLMGIRTKPAGILIFAVAAMLLFCGCGKASSAKLAEVKEVREALAGARAHAEETYDAICDDALFVRLTEAGKQADALSEIAASSMTDEEIDLNLLTPMRELTDAYAEMQEQLDQTAQEEEQERKEREGRVTLTFHIRNKSGRNFLGLSWMQGTEGRLSEILRMDRPLANGETLAGVTMTAMEESTQEIWLYGLLREPENSAESGSSKSEQADDKEQQEKESCGFPVGVIGEMNPEALFYLELLPDGEVYLTTDPANLAEKPSEETQEEPVKEETPAETGAPEEENKTNAE
ncbi:MAG: hypothetical protein K6G16_11455 [Lachnospiraceae bacterium]|nr:hypothetical protein [Lachnospiraceae bacterium]